MIVAEDMASWVCPDRKWHLPTPMQRGQCWSRCGRWLIAFNVPPRRTRVMFPGVHAAMVATNDRCPDCWDPF